MKSMKRATLAILSLVLFCLPAAHAAAPNPNAEASVAPVPSGSAAAAPTGMSIAAYAWPKETSEQPKEEEWAGATELESVTTVAASGWTKKPVQCRQRALRAWMRIDCSPPDPPTKEFVEGQRFYGSLWGLAGDMSGVSAQFQLVSAHESFAKTVSADPSNIAARLTRGMGARGTVIFQAKYGNATMLRLDEIFWADHYDGGNVLLSPGIVIDVSWALGETYPTIALHG